jgi:hypothetical protein
VTQRIALPCARVRGGARDTKNPIGLGLVTAKKDFSMTRMPKLNVCLYINYVK